MMKKIICFRGFVVSAGERLWEDRAPGIARNAGKGEEKKQKRNSGNEEELVK